MKKLILIFCLLAIPCLAQTYDPIVTPQGWAFGYADKKGISWVAIPKCAKTTSTCAANVKEARTIADKEFKSRKK